MLTSINSRRYGVTSRSAEAMMGDTLSVVLCVNAFLVFKHYMQGLSDDRDEGEAVAAKLKLVGGAGSGMSSRGRADRAGGCGAQQQET